MEKSKTAIALILVIVFVNLGLLIVISAVSPSPRSISVFDALKDSPQFNPRPRAATVPSTIRFEILRKNLDVEMAAAFEQGRVDVLVQAGKALEARETLWSKVNKAALASAFTSFICGLFVAMAVAKK